MIETKSGHEDGKIISSTARILKAVGGQYWLEGDNDFSGIATARGLFRLDKITPTPGDRVIYESSGDPDIPWRITEVLPRKNILIRPPLANLDLLLITVAATEPAADFFLIDKLIAACRINKIEPVLVITKMDIATETVKEISEPYVKCGFSVFYTSHNDSTAHEQLKKLLTSRIVSFAGQSGVGKSTLLNQLFGDEKMITGAISKKIGRGRHTTRHVELFPFAGGYLADTPGFSTLDLVELGLTSENIVSGYPEIESLAGQCRFASCRHLGDLGCAVEEARIDAGRLARYRQFRQQLDQIKSYENNSIKINSTKPRTTSNRRTQKNKQ
jgi:ribosome biogenesis GTPase